MLSDQELVQFTELAKKFEPQNTDAVLAVVQTNMHPVFQRINDGGRSAANLANKERMQQLDDQIKAFDTERTQFQTKIRELTDKTPDVAALRLDYEKKIELLTTQHKTALEEKDGLLVKVHRDRAVNELVDHLSGDLKIDRDYAREVIARRDDVQKRLRTKQDGSTDVLQAGNQELTITPAAGKTAIRHLAEELAPTVPDKFKASGITARGPQPKGAAPAGGGEKSKFDAIREQEKAGASKTNVVARPGLARLGGKPITAAE